MGNRGFTFVEILIVIAIIAIMMTIAIPSFSGIQQEAKQTKAQKDLTLLKIAIESYYRTHNEYPPEANYQSYLISASPRMIEDNMLDPFGATYSTQYQYYLSTKDVATAKYYVIYSIGVNTTGVAAVDNLGHVTINKGPIYVSNGWL